MEVIPKLLLVILNPTKPIQLRKPRRKSPKFPKRLLLPGDSSIRPSSETRFDPRNGTRRTLSCSTCSCSMLLHLSDSSASKHLRLLSLPLSTGSMDSPSSSCTKRRVGISGEFAGMKSVAQLDQKRGVKRNRDDKKIIAFPTVELNAADRPSTFIPVSQMEDALKAFNVASEI